MDNKLFSEGRGHYVIVTEDKKSFEWYFPIDITLDDNASMIQWLLDEVNKAIVEQKKQESEKMLNEKATEAVEVKKPEQYFAEKVVVC